MRALMNPVIAQIKQSPVAVRTLPFFIFILLTAAQGWFGEGGRYWLYLLKSIVGGWLLWTFRRQISEMRWKVSVEAVVVGIAVFVVWIGLSPALRAMGIDPSWTVLKSKATPWNPFNYFGHAVLAWFFVSVRIAGSSVVVPPLEEVFYRSFVYRYILKRDFLRVPLGQFDWTPFLMTSILFAFTHIEWLAGLLCGFAYQSLVCWKKRLGDAITAHAITNFLLGGWVVYKNAWEFW
ncbi:MAG: CAAX prenyl protease-related protein [Verrucomicrobia subdivision 3 bacterium]|nr:CAAX prenyl protease-related protein [Limisphaerales bacterium]